MPIIIDGREIQIPEEIPLARKAFHVPANECFGCYLGDCAPDMHDLPDACQYLGGYIVRLPAPCVRCGGAITEDEAGDAQLCEPCSTELYGARS